MGFIIRRVAAGFAATAAAVVARYGAEFGWRYLRGEDPPTTKDDQDDAQLRDVVLWSLVLTGSVLVARRIAKSTTKQLLKGDED